MKGSEIREQFLAFFESKQHRRVSSSALVPANDPTLLFTNAGMVQFKNVFLGGEKLDFNRATTSQKCLRVSGKHNDLENVGHTARHHTFFEMLGNFSFGDYFKEEACRFAYELIVDVYGIDLDRLIFTIYNDDDEAYEIWRNKIGIPEEKIFRLGEKDNFWSMGDTGPCGPCSEILVDQGPDAAPCDNPNCDINCDCDRRLEIWNLVFMQYDRDESGKMTPLPRPSIDTGMGLERISAIKQGVYTNYDTDLFMPLNEITASMAGIKYGDGAQSDTALRVISDHARAAAFLVGDGVLPSNEGRGYVLRRIMRRAARYGSKIGLNKPFLIEVTAKVIDLMEKAYPELAGRRAFVREVIENEEKRFLETLDKGLALLQEEIASLKSQSSRTIPGEVVFKLYDTFGFPADLTQVIASEEGLEIDGEGFEREMEEQRKRGRSSWKSGGGDKTLAVDEKTEFIGYDEFSTDSEVIGLYRDSAAIDKAGAGETVDATFTSTPFYAESGGQVGDTGKISWNGGEAEVLNTVKAGEAGIVHRLKVISGELAPGAVAKLSIDADRRRDVERNHSATHLLQAALIKILGEHVKQAGSYVGPERLRFDFSHFHAISNEQIDQVELEVNEQVMKNLPVNWSYSPYEEAVNSGAMAIFGEKYGDVVRLVKMGEFSAELCGGAHVRASGDIGLFSIVSEQGIAAGVRRIEAVTGRGAVNNLQQLRRTLESAATELKSSPSELAEKIAKIKADNKRLEKEVDGLKTKMAAGGGGGADRNLLADAFEIKTGRAVVARIHIDDPKLIRQFGDTISNQIKDGVIVLGAEDGDKAMMMIMVVGGAEPHYRAGDMVKELAPIFGGRGGGKPTMAQAGGGDPQKLDEALLRARQMLSE